MSFINSVLSSLNDGTSTIPTPHVRPPKASNTIAGTGQSQAQKRRADNDLNEPSAKSAKLTNLKSSNNERSPALTPVSRTKVPERPKLPQQRSETKRTEPKPDRQKPSRQAHQPSEVIKRPEPGLQPPKIPPKKNTFAEILARGSQNQSAPVVGQITHKPKEKLSAKKQLALQKEMAIQKKKALLVRGAQTGPGGKSASGASKFSTNLTTGAKADIKKPSYQGTSKPKVQTMYQGTMKPKAQVAYQGTMKADLRPQKSKGYDSEPDRHAKDPTSSSHRRGYHSEELSDEGNSEENYDYASEDYSDMDAGFDDVEEEDEKASKIAKKEDAYEQRMLEELKRQKEERKRRALAGKEKERSMRL